MYQKWQYHWWNGERAKSRMIKTESPDCFVRSNTWMRRLELWMHLWPSDYPPPSTRMFATLPWYDKHKLACTAYVRRSYITLPHALSLQFPILAGLLRERRMYDTRRQPIYWPHMAKGLYRVTIAYELQSNFFFSLKLHIVCMNLICKI